MRSKRAENSNQIENSNLFVFEICNCLHFTFYSHESYIYICNAMVEYNKFSPRCVFFFHVCVYSIQCMAKCDCFNKFQSFKIDTNRSRFSWKHFSEILIEVIGFGELVSQNWAQRHTTDGKIWIGRLLKLIDYSLLLLRLQHCHCTDRWQKKQAHTLTLYSTKRTQPNRTGLGRACNVHSTLC